MGSGGSSSVSPKWVDCNLLRSGSLLGTYLRLGSRPRAKRKTSSVYFPHIHRSGETDSDSGQGRYTRGTGPGGVERDLSRVSSIDLGRIGPSRTE